LARPRRRTSRSACRCCPSTIGATRSCGLRRAPPPSETPLNPATPSRVGARPCRLRVKLHVRLRGGARPCRLRVKLHVRLRRGPPAHRRTRAHARRGGRRRPSRRCAKPRRSEWPASAPRASRGGSVRAPAAGGLARRSRRWTRSRSRRGLRRAMRAARTGGERRRCGGLCASGGTRCAVRPVRLMARGEGRGVSGQYGGRDEACPVSTGGETRRVRLVRWVRSGFALRRAVAPQGGRTPTPDPRGGCLWEALTAVAGAGAAAGDPARVARGGRADPDVPGRPAAVAPHAPRNHRMRSRR
jgi:hypothetical protein